MPGSRLGIISASMQLDKKATVTVFDASDATRLLKSDGNKVTTEDDIITKWTSAAPPTQQSAECGVPIGRHAHSGTATHDGTHVQKDTRIRCVLSQRQRSRCRIHQCLQPVARLLLHSGYLRCHGQLPGSAHAGRSLSGCSIGGRAHERLSALETVAATHTDCFLRGL